MRYDKLVRDRIPEIIAKNGDTALTHTANDSEYWAKLCEKLHEEAQEFTQSPSENELADILEVLEAIYVFKQYDKLSVETIRQEKHNARGGFDLRLILEETT